MYGKYHFYHIENVSFKFYIYHCNYQEMYEKYNLLFLKSPIFFIEICAITLPKLMNIQTTA